ncbi:hypothetical protein GH714_035104 [Hevea brasiliensis]|uniref:Fe2OG dioxygenase domain-containing protein n=1 Tax=Hevea brasiliensis TaxID=3981 RepID=A0A6A6KDP1_HEVBR|nr:hypothetical protein GH714_035104 [Hevea brasiliensis]
MSTLSEVYTQYPLKVDDIIPLDFDSVVTVPDSHAWPISDGFESNDWLSIPTIDLKDPDTAKLIGHACETWGVFQVVNHDIPLNLLDEVEAGSSAFLSSDYTKAQGLKVSWWSHRIRLSSNIVVFQQVMWHEGFTIIGSPLDHARELWPNDYQKFCDIMVDGQKKMEELAITIMHNILEYLAVSEEEMKWLGSPGVASTALQLNSYPLCPDPNRAIGLAPHTDTSLFTILHQRISGLQIFKEGVGWGLVQPVTGALVVNVGDLLHILSNARFPSVVHRVVMKEAKQRFSVAFFYSPPADFNLDPLGLSFGQIPLYRSVTVAEYVGRKAKDLEKALASIRI